MLHTRRQGHWVTVDAVEGAGVTGIAEPAPLLEALQALGREGWQVAAIGRGVPDGSLYVLQLDTFLGSGSTARPPPEWCQSIVFFRGRAEQFLAHWCCLPAT